MAKRKHNDEDKQSKKAKGPDNEIHLTKENKSQETENMWSNSDLLQLISQVERYIPENDNVSYGCRMEKINWNDVVFKRHAVKDCKNMWSNLLKQVRKFRLLEEIINDMKLWLHSAKSHSLNEKLYKHPDKPKQPQNSFMLFVEEKRSEIIKQFPNCNAVDISKKLGQVFKTLPSDEKERYNQMAKTARQEYMEKLKQFYLEHPEAAPKKSDILKNITVTDGKLPPEKPKTPFQLFVQVESEKGDNEEARCVLQQKCREAWNEMNDKDKLFWINWADEQYNNYIDDVKNYIKIHPDYDPGSIRPVISKKEKGIRDKYLGKPEKPPYTAYHLYTKIVMEDEQFKKISYKDAITCISEKWKACSVEERNEYKVRVEQMWDNYQKNLNKYLMTLTPEERANFKEVKRKTKANFEEEKISKNSKNMKLKKPTRPPSTAYKYFLSIYKGKDNSLNIWKTMTTDEKQIYEDQLVEMKQNYIVSYEKYLKSLSKEELQKLEAHNDASGSTSDSECSISEEEDVEGSRQQM